jgi:hypothetical protein
MPQGSWGFFFARPAAFAHLIPQDQASVAPGQLPPDAISEVVVFGLPAPGATAGSPAACAVIRLKSESVAQQALKALEPMGTPADVAGVSALKVTAQQTPAAAMAMGPMGGQSQEGYVALVGSKTLLAANDSDNLAAIIKTYQAGAGKPNPALQELAAAYADSPVYGAAMLPPEIAAQLQAQTAQQAPFLAGLTGGAFGLDVTGEVFDLAMAIRFGESQQAQTATTELQGKLAEARQQVQQKMTNEQMAPMMQPLQAILSKVAIGMQAADMTVNMSVSIQDIQAAAGGAMMLMTGGMGAQPFPMVQ